MSPVDIIKISFEESQMAFSPFQFTHWLYHPQTTKRSHFIKLIQKDTFTSEESLRKAGLTLFPYSGEIDPLTGKEKKPNGHEETPTAPIWF
jgi:hypothetical protein